MDTSVSTKNNESSSRNSDSSKVLGGLLGGAVGLALICAILCYLIYRQQKRYSKEQKKLKTSKVRFTGSMLEKELNRPVLEPPLPAAQPSATRLVPLPPPPRT